MSPREQERRLATLERVCRERGIPLTIQRRAVLQAVLDLDSHPTADAVHARLRARYPSLSRATVYRALEALLKTGTVVKVCHPGTAVRYEGRTEPHHHLVCLRCDTITDFTDARLDALPLPDDSRLGFRISEARVHLRGVCRRCLEKEKRHEEKRRRNAPRRRGAADRSLR